MAHVPQDRHLTVAITPFSIGLGVAGLAGLLLLWLLVAHALDALVLLLP